MEFRVAQHEHDEGLRRLCRESVAPGWVRLAFAREPDYFLGVGVQGAYHEVLVMLEHNRVAGMGCRSIRPAWVNGREAAIGYLSGLRLSPDIRRNGALARAYAACRGMHARHPAPAYLTTVLERNTQAIALLTSHRAGLPHYLDRGRYVTYAICPNRRRPRAPRREVRRGDQVPLGPILAFLNRQGATRQFFPILRTADFGTGYLRDLKPADFRVALGAGGAIVGVAAVWDQARFKQNIVAGYAPALRLARPALNGALRLAGLPPLPKPGAPLRMRCLAFCCAEENDPAILRAILDHVCAEPRADDLSFLVAGFHERDPLGAAVTAFPAFRYTSRLYLVCWDDGLAFVRNLDAAAVPHLDVATM